MPQQHINKQTEEGISERYALFLFCQARLQPSVSAQKCQKSKQSQHHTFGVWFIPEQTKNIKFVYIFKKKVQFYT